ncbi:MAG: dephospho-CoA kinase [Clostridia bacterium]|nr:dephospho-CoA kinase [Clostridia bacterium]
MKQSNIKIAVTGGIGSGKSTVCKIIEKAGYPVYSCDAVYSQLLNGKYLPGKIAEVFGSEILNTDGSLNRRALSEIVFGNEQLLQKLNNITHPEIFKAMLSMTEGKSGLVFFEVPLLFECGYQNLFDEVIVVLRDRDSRIDSVIKRDGLTEQEIVNRINRQFNYTNLNFEQYYVIHNKGNIDDLCDATNDLLLKIAQKHNR